MANILIVDDESGIQSALGEILRVEGHDVFAAGGFKECIDILIDATVDVVVTDYQLEGKDGLEILKFCKELNSDIEVVLMSGHPTVDVAITAIRLGAFDYIVKPLRYSDFCKVVKKAADRKMKAESNKRIVRLGEERYRHLVDNANDLIWRTDFDGRVVDVNPASQIFLGYTTSEAIGCGMDDYLTPESSNRIRQWVKEALKARPRRNCFGGEIDYLNRNGKIVPADLRATMLSDDSGRVVFIEGISRNITERKEYEEALKKSEELFKSIVNNSADLTTITDAKGVITYISPKCESVLGYPSDKFIGQVMPDIIHPDDLERCRKTWEQVARQGLKLHDYKYRIIDAQGMVRWVSHSAKMVEVDGKAIGMQNTVRNITERKLAEEALRESEQRYRLVVDNVSDVIVVLDLSLRPLFVSQSAERVLGYSAEETLALGPAGLMTAESLLAVMETSTSLLTHGSDKPPQTISTEISIRRKDGIVILCESNARFLRHADGTPFGILTVIRDITERKLAEEALRESQKRYMAMVNLVPNAILTTELDGTITFVNERTPLLLGYDDKSKIIGRNMLELLCDEEVDRARDNLHLTMSGQNPGPSDYRCKHGSKRDLYMEVHADLLHDEQGKPKGWQIVANDTTERRLATEKLSKQKWQLSEALRIAQMGYWEWRPDTNIIMMSNEFSKILGLQSQNETVLSNLEIHKIVHPDDREWVINAFKYAATEQKPIDLEYRVIRSDGEVLYLNMRSEVWRDPVDGSMIIRGFGQDITARKIMKNEIHKHEKELHALLNATSDAAFLLDKEGRLIAVNEALARVFNTTVSDLTGRIGFDFLSNDLRETRIQKLKYSFDTGNPITFRDCREGREELHSVYPIIDDGGCVSHLAIYSRDVTDQVEAEKRLTVYHDQLRALAMEITMIEENERRKLATMMHDGICQELALANIQLKMLSQDIADSDKVKQLSNTISLIDKNIKNARSLTIDLYPPALYELNFIDAMRWLHNKCLKDTGIEGRFDTSIETLAPDEEVKIFLFHVIRELFVNTSKHAHASRIDISINCDEELIYINVVDDGIGFSPDLINRNPSREGGFGLFSLRERMKYLGGEIIINSVTGEGTTASINTPIHIKVRH